MDKYSKLADNLNTNYVSYYRHGKSVTHSFQVRYNSNNEIDLLVYMDKRLNIKNDWYVSNEKGNITKEEFEAELAKTILFLTDKKQ